MPVSEGFIGEKKAKFFRDTGCISAAVRNSLVLDTQLIADAVLDEEPQKICTTFLSFLSFFNIIFLIIKKRFN